MKKRKTGKILAVFAALNIFAAYLLPVSASAQPAAAVSAEAYKQPKIEKRSTKEYKIFYFDNLHTGKLKLTYFNGHNDLPYITAENAAALIDRSFEMTGDKDAHTSVKNKDGVITLKRENGASAVVDTKKNTVTFDSFNMFSAASYAASPMDKVTLDGFDDLDRPEYIERYSSSIEVPDAPLKVDLSDYNITLIYDKDTGYIPLQTFSDLFLSGFYSVVVCNGKAVYLTQALQGMLSFNYYSAPTEKISPELAKYSYNELCLALDLFYGLKEEHGITSFDELFRKTGLYDEFMSGSALKADRALNDLLKSVLDDLHSGLVNPSYRTGNSANVDISKNANPSYDKLVAYLSKFKRARNAAYPKGVPAYEEIGDTAFITFDNFTLPMTYPALPTDRNYYRDPPKKKEAESGKLDNIGLIIYAHSQIMRDKSPIKNVVLDLSCNTGGYLDSAAMTIAWFLGKAPVSITTDLTGSYGTVNYRFDANLDRKFDKKDELTSKNLYCIVSPVSFSCGNLVPCTFSEIPEITLLGQTSSGGTCAVGVFSTAYGSVFNISGPEKFSTVINGAYINIEEGARVDIPITKIENFYDRKKLAKYISGLL